MSGIPTEELQSRRELRARWRRQQRRDQIDAQIRGIDSAMQILQERRTALQKEAEALKPARLRVRVAALENREGSTYDRCDECKQLEAVMVAMIKSLNERITALEKKIDELEASRVIVTDPVYPTFDHLMRPWSVTYDTAGNPIW